MTNLTKVIARTKLWATETEAQAVAEAQPAEEATYRAVEVSTLNPDWGDAAASQGLDGPKAYHVEALDVSDVWLGSVSAS